MSELAPIAIFAYNRSDHVKKVVESLASNQEFINSPLFVFIDGPKNDFDKNENTKIEKFFIDLKKFRELKIINSNLNNGLSKSIVKGVDRVLNDYEKIIVLEDDIVVSSQFLYYINTALNLYEKENAVASIHGYAYPIEDRLPETFFLRGADCWGWGTWRRAWKNFNDDGRYLLKKIQESEDREIFNFEGYGGYIQMLEDTNQGKKDSWAIKWYASTFLREMYTLYPGKSLVKNIGLDGTGTHGGIDKKANNQKLVNDIIVKKIPIVDNQQARRAFVKYFRSQNRYKRYKISTKIRNVFSRKLHD